MGYRSIVVGTDGSETAERAVRHAAALAADEGSRLIVVSAYQAEGDRTARGEHDQVPEDLRYRLTDRAQTEELCERGRAIAREAGVTKVVVQALEGDPQEVLIEAARDFDADLIVVGSKGLTSHAHFILGSVASSVAHHAPCDVLVAHTTKVDA
jgi:nucleotide-binding universal stress UspA family protein